MNGEKILHYRIEQPAYENALFRYFVGTHTTFSKKVLIKTPKTAFSPEEQDKLTTETRQFARLQHPTLTTLYDYLEREEGTYTVLDYHKGNTLADYVHLQHGLLPEEQAIATLLQLVEVWEAAHKIGIFGGVIRPSHIVLTTEYTLKVQEIALSQFYTQKIIQVSDLQNMAYLAPEFWQVGTTVDERADIYGLGMLLFELLTAKMPYKDLSASDMRTKITTENLPSPKQFYPAISPATEEIVRKATTINPAERYQSCAQMHEALLAWKAAPVALPAEKPSEKTPLPTPEKQSNKPTFDISQYKTLNLLPWLLGVSVLTLGLLSWSYVGKTKESKSEVLANIQDEGRIKFFQDSIAKAQLKKSIDDSIKRSKEIAKKVTVAEPFMHRVRLGESLDRIARRYYITLDTLKKMNGMTGKEVLKPKTGIKIPVRAIYHMKDKETVEMVGQKYNINPAVLKEVNQLYPKPAKAGEFPEPVIFEGKEIIIPLMMPAKK